MSSLCLVTIERLSPWLLLLQHVKVHRPRAAGQHQSCSSKLNRNNFIKAPLTQKDNHNNFYQCPPEWPYCPKSPCCSQMVSLPSTDLPTSSEESSAPPDFPKVVPRWTGSTDGTPAPGVKWQLWHQTSSTTLNKLEKWQLRCQIRPTSAAVTCSHLPCIVQRGGVE